MVLGVVGIGGFETRHLALNFFAFRFGFPWKALEITLD